MRISKPKVTSIDPHYINECEEALAPAFNDLSDFAEQRGWNGTVVAMTLLSLAKSNLNHKSAGAEFESVLQAVRASALK